MEESPLPVECQRRCEAAVAEACEFQRRAMANFLAMNKATHKAEEAAREAEEATREAQEAARKAEEATRKAQKDLALSTLAYQVRSAEDALLGDIHAALVSARVLKSSPDNLIFGNRMPPSSAMRP